MDLISNQDPNYSIDPSAIRSIKVSAKREHHQSLTCEANAIKALLSQEQVRAMELAQERGASSWLSTLPLEEHGFALHKGGFRDAISLRYLWDLPRTPVHCACGQKFDVDHAMCCPKGGFPTLRHNEVRDLTADLLTEVCGDVEESHCCNVSQVNSSTHPLTSTWMLAPTFGHGGLGTWTERILRRKGFSPQRAQLPSFSTPHHLSTTSKCKEA